MTSPFRSLLLGCVATLFLFNATADARTWSSPDGQKTFEGELVYYNPETAVVRVRMAGGNEITFNQDRLSDPDIEFLKTQNTPPQGDNSDTEMPRPDGRKADMTKPVQVFILLGQSNMIGFGRISGENDPGSLEHATKKENLYPFLVDENGGWTVRKDVRNVRVMNDMEVFNNEWMTIKGRAIGPEVAIGHHMGNILDAPVMILKSCIGNRSLGWDLLPPGSKRFEFNGKIYAGYGDFSSSWPIGEAPPERGGWYAGKQYDTDIGNARNVLDQLDTYYPGATEYEVAGFFWWQGDKDFRDAGHAARYEHNLVQLIKQLRKEFDVPNAKFVCASLGQTRKGAGVCAAA